MGTVAREIKAIRQSNKNKYISIKTGIRVFAVNSGTICARGSSSFSTVSTNMDLYFPDGVSKIVPIGIRASFAVMAFRIWASMVNAARWERMVE